MTLKHKLISFALGVMVTSMPAAFSQSARTVMVQSNSGVLLFPSNLWSANAAAARSGLSLAAHATNPIVPLANGGTGATNSGLVRTNLGLGVSDNVAFNSVLFGGGVAIDYNQIRWENNVMFDLESRQINDIWNFDRAPLFSDAAGVRTNLGMPLAVLTNTSTAGFLSALNLNTNSSPSFTAVSSQYLGTDEIRPKGVTNRVISISDSYLAYAGAVSGVALEWGATNIGLGLPLKWLTNSHVAATRTNLGLGWPALTNTTDSGFRSALGLGAAWLTNTNVTNFRTEIGLGPTNSVTFKEITTEGLVSRTAGVEIYKTVWFGDHGSDVFQFEDANYKEIARANLGIPWSGLTSTNAATFQGALFAATNAAPTNTTNVAAWINLQVGTNTYKLPLYQ